MKPILHFLALPVVLCVAAASAMAAPRPHIVFVMADDMGWGQTGYRGHPVLETPHLDAMAEGGLRFERFYAGGPVCSPTRASVLTGRSHDRAGVLTHGYALREMWKERWEFKGYLGRGQGQGGKKREAGRGARP